MLSPHPIRLFLPSSSITFPPFSSLFPTSFSYGIVCANSRAYAKMVAVKGPGRAYARFLHSTSSVQSSLSDAKRNQAAKIDQLTRTLGEIESKRVEKNKKLNERVRPIIAQMERTVCAPNGRSRLLLVGSIASGLAMDFDQGASDLDLAFYFAGSDQNESRQFMEDMWGASRGFIRIFLSAIADGLKQLGEELPEFQLSSPPLVISHTFVPIIIGKFANGTSFDIQFPRQNYQAMRNTLMVRYYISADPRFPQLFHWLRRIFLMMGVKNSKDGLFSSYHTLLLVIHFLQRREEFNNVLPVLFETHRDLLPTDVAKVVQALDEEPSSDKNALNWTSRCTKSVGELALEMVNYYAHFDPRTTAISIQQGRTMNIAAEKQRFNRLEVYDPFSHIISTRSPLLAEALTMSFQFLRKRLSKGQYLASFPQLDGITEDFANEAKAQGMLWVKLLSRTPDVGAPIGFEEEEYEEMGSEEGEENAEKEEQENGDREGRRLA